MGASSGIGRELGIQAAAAGWQVGFAARRTELVEQAAADAGGGAVGLRCDVRDEASCRDVVAAALDAFGGRLDALVYATGIDVLVRLTEADMARWRDTYETNVFGAAQVCRFALPHLSTSGGRAVFVSASSTGRPLPGMGVYASSKAALEELVRAWQAEHREVAFVSARVGSALPTGILDSWDRDLLVELSPTWQARGYVDDNGPGRPMTVEEAAGALLLTLTAPAWLREVTIVNDPGIDSRY